MSDNQCNISDTNRENMVIEEELITIKRKKQRKIETYKQTYLQLLRWLHDII